MILFLSQQQSLLHAPSKIQQSLFLKLPTLYHFIFLVSECFVFKAYSVSWVGICRVGICLIFPFMLIITQHFRNKKLFLFTLLKVYSFYFVFYSILAMYICFMWWLFKLISEVWKHSGKIVIFLKVKPNKIT